MEVLIEEPAPGAENMRRDAELLRSVAAGQAAGSIRIYGFSPPCLSLGRLQSEAEVDWAACARDGVEVVRRPTGGRAVLHDEEVTYSVVCRADDARFGGIVLESCARIHAVVASALRTLGVIAIVRTAAADERTEAQVRAADGDCFAHAASHELVDQSGRKLVGSAQARSGPALLQHGSVILAPARTGDYLREQWTSASNGTGLRPLVGAGLSRRSVVEALAAAFSSATGIAAPSRPIC